jgi:ABC-type sugar transport system substrate-binding protein/DNA-binding response OmpR family regulator/nitrogen-specific signal transduction histidine kinase
MWWRERSQTKIETILNRVIQGACFGFFIAVLVSCQQAKNEKKYTIGFSQCTGLDAWRRQMLASMKGELAFYPDMELLYRDAENSSERQIADIEDFIEAKVDLLIVSPNETDPITPVVEKAFLQGIPVIMVDRKINSSFYSAYIGANNYEVGKLAGDYIAELLNGKGKIVEIWGLRGSSPAADRHRGLWEVLSNFPNINLVGEIDGKWERDTSKVQVQRRITSFPAFDLVFAHNDVMGYGAYTVCREIFPDNKIKFIGVDALPGPIAGIQFVDDKILTASFLYPTGGEESIRIANQILKGLPYEKENTLLSTVIDTKNVRLMKLQYDKLLSQQKDIVRQQELINQQIQTYYSQRILIFVLLASLIVMIVASAIATLNWLEKTEINKRLESKSKEILEQRNTIAEIAEKAELATQEKLKFFTNISHEFKTPLTLIMAPVEELMSNKEDNKNRVTENLWLIKKNAMRLLRLVNQLMDFRKIEDKKMTPKVSEHDLVYFIGEVMSAFDKVALKRKIEFRMATELSQLNVWFDPDMMDKVIFNLLSNAFKFTNDRGKVILSIAKDEAEKNILIWIEDNGLGMSPEHVTHAFDRFYTGDNLMGNGIGLSLSKELIDLHHGSLTLKSEKGVGTRFCISLPLGNAHFDEQELISGKVRWDRNSLYDFLSEGNQTQYQPAAENGNAEKGATVLLIDDNVELRQFVKDRLQTRYKVEEAGDGITGMRLAFETVPDIIICDVMLPGKDGFEVIKALKEDLRTSHIPAIVLTAKDAIDQKIVGARSGADEYITKPFVMEYLLERIAGLIRSRELLKEHYSHDIHIEHPEVTPGALDKKFINDFSALVEKNISNAELHVNDIGHELGMSRVQVYRKVKALLGYSVNDYIVNVRLKAAKHLLLNTDKSIQEISEEVGFSSPTYFSTAFKSKFKASPREFKSHKNIMV